MVSLRQKRLLFIFSVVSVVVFLIWDRYLFAQVASWREEQATNLWLGYQLLDVFPSIGITSSTGLANPNGIPLYTFLLSQFGGLFEIGFAMGLLHLFSFLFLSYCLYQQDKKTGWLYFIVICSSGILRASPLEIWNQWVPTPFLVTGIAILLLKSTKAHFWSMFVFIFSVHAIMSFYLAGLLHFCLLSLALVFVFRKNIADKKYLFNIGLSHLIWGIVFYFLCWKPYFNLVSLDEVRSISTLTFKDRLTHSIGSLGQLHKAFQYYSTLDFGFALTNTKFIGNALYQWKMLLGYILEFQSIVFCATLFFLIREYGRNFYKKLTPLSKNSLLLGSLALVAFPLGAFLGAPRYDRGERVDQIIPFLPLFLILIFVATYTMTFHISKFASLFRKLTWSSAFAYAVIAIPLGHVLIYQQLHDERPFISDADAPLKDRLEALEWIVSDWKKIQPEAKTVPIFYKIKPDGMWNNVEGQSQSLERYYAISPLTFGRALDYELSKKYGMKNYQEGVPLIKRTPENAQYIYTYTFEPFVEGFKLAKQFGKIAILVPDKPTTKY